MNHLERRQNQTGAPDADVNGALQTIYDSMGKDFLGYEEGIHPLQILWHRRDALATNELFFFGELLRKTKNLFPNWTKGQVKSVKQREENNQKGAIFEIICVGAAIDSNEEVIPGPDSQPGYDMDVKTKDVTYRVSLKRHAMSKRESEFRKNANKAEKMATKGLAISKHNAGIFVEANQFPSDSDWEDLFKELYDLTSQFNGVLKNHKIGNVWNIDISPMFPAKGKQFSPVNQSYTFICTSPYHKNEQANFYSKLQSAVSNLEKHVSSDTNIIPMIMMELPETASTIEMEKWVKDYFEEYPETCLKGVIFIQPFIATIPLNSNVIAFNVVPAFRNELDAFLSSLGEGNTLELIVPVGVTTNSQPTWASFGKPATYLNEKYVFQKGFHYYLMKVDANGEIVGDAGRIGVGVETIAVLHLGNQYTEIKGRFGHDLVLIGG